MDELIYRFLLQSGYPRAAIVSDLGLLPLAGGPGADAHGSGAYRPAYAIVDPATGDRLAVLDVLDAVDADGLHAAADDLARYGRRFGGSSVQGFLVRIDPDGRSVDEQVQFYRAWPNETLERVSTKAFPDLDSMRTWQRLAERRDRSDADAARSSSATVSGATAAARAAVFGDEGGDEGGDESDLARSASERAAQAMPATRVDRPGAGVWLPGLGLAALAVADAVTARVTGDGLLGPVPALLLLGAASLLLVAGVARRG